MHKNYLFLTLALLLPSCSCEKPKESKKSTISIIKEIVDFEELKGYDKALVQFYASWCGACKAAAKPLEKLVKDYPNITFLAVDVDKDGDLKEKYQPQGIPTFILFKKGEKIDAVLGFDQERIKQLLDKPDTKKVEEKTSKIVSIKDKKHFEKEVKDHEKVIVKFYGDWCGFCKLITPDYKKLSEEYGDKVKFLEVELTKNQDLAKEHDIRGVPAFVSFEKGSKTNSFSGANKQKLEETVKKLAG